MPRTVPTIDRDFANQVLQHLVRTNSVNSSLVPGAPGEAGVADVTGHFLSQIGLDVARHEPAPGRPSIVGRLAGTGGGRSLMLNAHYDTVGVEGMADAFSGEIRDGRLYGRGAYDMKGALAACIAAVKALRDSGVRLAGDVLVAAVADEEHASAGTQDLIGRYSVDGAIVTEPTSLQLCIAHKGFVWTEVITRGRAAHGSRPDLGIDANLRMGRVLQQLEILERTLRDRLCHPLLRYGSLHAAMLQGGTGLSTYAAECRLGIERRTIPGETEAQVLAEIDGILAALLIEDPELQVERVHLLTREPFEARVDSALVPAVEQAATVTLGAPPERVGETPWMDAALLSAAGVDTVVIGPHGAGAHAAIEWVDLESVWKLAEILVGSAIAYCGT
jgi:acetylornithine deacetylase